MLWQAARRRFPGGWPEALAAVNVDYDEVRATRRWTRARVVAEIERLNALGEALWAESIRLNHKPLYRAAIRRFPSSWGKALRAAGLNPDDHKAPPRGRTIEGVAEWVRRQDHEDSG